MSEKSRSLTPRKIKCGDLFKATENNNSCQYYIVIVSEEIKDRSLRIDFNLSKNDRLFACMCYDLINFQPLGNGRNYTRANLLKYPDWELVKRDGKTICEDCNPEL